MANASLLSASPGAPPAEPAPEQLRALVLDGILRACGPQLPVARAAEVIDAFWERFGVRDGTLICRQALEARHGMWRGAPVTVLRFQEGHDEFFSLPLLAEARKAAGEA